MSWPEQALVCELRSRLTAEGLPAERGMEVDDVGVVDDGAGAVVEVRFRHRARPGSSFVVRFPLTDGQVFGAEEEGEDEAIGAAATVIWANVLEIASMPNDYLPRRGGRDVEVFAW